MRLLTKTHYTGSFDDTSDMTHVLLDLDPRDRLDMQARLADVLALPEIYSVTFFDWAPQPVSIGVEGDVPTWFEEEAEVLVIPDGALPAQADLQIAAPTVCYMPDGLIWCFYEKHGGASYETATIPWDFIRAAEKIKGGERAKLSR